MKSVKETNILSKINIGNITDSFNIDVGDVLSGNNLLNNTTVLSGILNNNSILEGGILNGNDIDVSPTVDLGLVGDVGDVLSGNGDLSALNKIANLDVGGITDAVDVLSNIKVDDGLVNVLNDALNVDVTGNTLTGLVSKVQDLDILTEPTAIVSDVLNPTAKITDVLDATAVGKVGVDLVGALTKLDFGQIGPGIDLGDIGALIGAEAVTNVLPLPGIHALVNQVDLFGVIDADAA